MYMFSCIWISSDPLVQVQINVKLESYIPA